MKSACKLVLLLVFSARFSVRTLIIENYSHHEKLFNYITSLVKYLASKQVKTFDYWLYHACSDPPGSSSQLLQTIYNKLQPEPTPRISTNSRFVWDLVVNRVRLPSLGIVDYTSSNISVWKNYGHLVGSLTVSTRLIVLLSTGSKTRISFIAFIPTFTLSKRYNDVAFISTDEEMIIV